MGVVMLVAACGASVEPPAQPSATPARTATPATDASPSRRLPSPSPTAPAVDPASPIPATALRGTIAYSTDTADGADDIFLLRLDGSDPVRLTTGPERELDPALSPDGSRIVYRRNPRAGSDAADLWLMAVDGSGKRNLTNAADASNWAPAWTPDGRIAFTSQRGGNGTLDLWTMAANGSDPRRVTEGWCEYAQPSPDGSRFVCAAAVGGRYDLVIVDARTGARTALTTTPQTEFGPSWSPDGRWIAFARDLGERWALLRIRPDGSAEQEVATEGVFPTWDPDGHLVWSGPGGINVAHADGSARTVIDVPAGFVSWVP
jgi:Tol biopolymer transport system component